jgi:hypothetical protein
MVCAVSACAATVFLSGCGTESPAHVAHVAHVAQTYLASTDNTLSACLGPIGIGQAETPSTTTLARCNTQYADTVEFGSWPNAIISADAQTVAADARSDALQETNGQYPSVNNDPLIPDRVRLATDILLLLIMQSP